MFLFLLSNMCVLIHIFINKELTHVDLWPVAFKSAYNLPSLRPIKVDGTNIFCFIQVLSPTQH